MSGLSDQHSVKAGSRSKNFKKKLKHSVSGLLSACGRTAKANLSGRLIAPDTEVVPSTGLKPSGVAHGTALCLTLLVCKMRIIAVPPSKSSGENQNK